MSGFISVINNGSSLKRKTWKPDISGHTKLFVTKSRFLYRITGIKQRDKKIIRYQIDKIKSLLRVLC